MFPRVTGIPDFRLVSDRYLSLDDDRAKARRLAHLADRRNAQELAEAYYAMTPDVDARRRDRFLSHLRTAEQRGQALLELLPRAGRILEVGCGSGGFLAAAALADRDVRGIDIASRWLVVARRRLDDQGLPARVVAASADHLPWPDRSFDVVVADSVVEHLGNPDTALREWARVLRPGGRLLVWSPNRLALTTDPHVGLWGVGWLPPRWATAYVRRRRRCDWPIRLLSVYQARNLARHAGFREVRIEAAGLPAHWFRARPQHVRLAHRVYESSRATPGLRSLVRALGPLWQLTAIRGEGA